ncbi:P-loop containing nucleoside triphosphate hydrolase protein, partial [Sistotremastrum suecicum HHB10207 ss-3]
LGTGGVFTPKDLLLSNASIVARRVKLSVTDVKAIVQLVCQEVAPKPRPASDAKQAASERFTTGDDRLDGILGGGITPSLIWELCGESAAGKSQLAFQLALTVQLPKKLGGLGGSCCFITTTATLPTHRILQLIEEHPLLSSTTVSLADIHTLKTTTFASFLYAISHLLPPLI